jgi:hypothetical protein
VDTVLALGGVALGAETDHSGLAGQREEGATQALRQVVGVVGLIVQPDGLLLLVRR